MSKVLIITDSSGLPRPFPRADKTNLEETYSYLLKKKLGPSHSYYQLSLGGVPTHELVSHVTGYLSHWMPDFIVVQSGMNDCRPAPYSKITDFLIKNVPLISRFRKFLYSPKTMNFMIKLKRARPTTSIRKFKKSIKKLQLLFPESKILWMEIYTSNSGHYENARPGVLKNIEIYNSILRKNFKDSFIEINHGLNEVGGICKDHIHINSKGHRWIFERLIEEISDKNNAVFS